MKGFGILLLFAFICSAPTNYVIQNKNFFVFNAADYTEIHEPFLLENDPSSFTKKVMHASPVDRVIGARSGKNTGHAKYRFYLQKPGVYYLWLNAWWVNACASRFYINIGSSDPAYTAGGDAVYLKWHWTGNKKTLFDLSAGEQYIYIGNCDPLTKYQQIILTDDPDFIPRDADFVLANHFGSVQAELLKTVSGYWLGRPFTGKTGNSYCGSDYFTLCMSNSFRAGEFRLVSDYFLNADPDEETVYTYRLKTAYHDKANHEYLELKLVLNEVFTNFMTMNTEKEIIAWANYIKMQNGTAEAAMSNDIQICRTMLLPAESKYNLFSVSMYTNEKNFCIAVNDLPLYNAHLFRRGLSGANLCDRVYFEAYNDATSRSRGRFRMSRHRQLSFNMRDCPEEQNRFEVYNGPSADFLELPKNIKPLAAYGREPESILDFSGDEKCEFQEEEYITDEESGAKVLFGNISLNNYTARAAVYPVRGYAGFVFYYQNELNHYNFFFSSSNWSLKKICRGRVDMLAENSSGYAPQKWHNFRLDMFQNNIQIAMNNKTIVNVYDIEDNEENLQPVNCGFFGFYTGDKALYDDLIITSSRNFFDGFGGCDNNNTASWEIVEGQWHKSPNLELDSAGLAETFMCQSSNRSLSVSGRGEDLNYSMEAKIFSPDNKWAGLIFNYQDKDNYYLYRVPGQNFQTNAQLLKIQGGKSSILASASQAYSPDTWFQMKAGLKNGAVDLYFNDQQLMAYADFSFLKGRYGLYSWGNISSYFDNIHVVFENSSEKRDIYSLDYNSEEIKKNHDSNYSPNGMLIGDFEHEFDVINNGSRKLFIQYAVFKSADDPIRTFTYAVDFGKNIFSFTPGRKEEKNTALSGELLKKNNLLTVKNINTYLFFYINNTLIHRTPNPHPDAVYDYRIFTGESGADSAKSVFDHASAGAELQNETIYRIFDNFYSFVNNDYNRLNLSRWEQERGFWNTQALYHGTLTITTNGWRSIFTETPEEDHIIWYDIPPGEYFGVDIDVNKLKNSRNTFSLFLKNKSSNNLYQMQFSSGGNNRPLNKDGDSVKRKVILYKNGQNPQSFFNLDLFENYDMVSLCVLRDCFMLFVNYRLVLKNPADNRNADFRLGIGQTCYHTAELSEIETEQSMLNQKSWPIDRHINIIKLGFYPVNIKP
ncbi:MAG: hypothetical protein A2096_04905 [Spirochaetes bacterium GWF1_41_5]|nr:MAG: hypothetical protein A2096_04905 [Spirochaetes bacterium GWF1_41_5]